VTEAIFGVALEVVVYMNVKCFSTLDKLLFRLMRVPLVGRFALFGALLLDSEGHERTVLRLRGAITSNIKVLQSVVQA
jgi:hypothetical protein